MLEEGTQPAFNLSPFVALMNSPGTEPLGTVATAGVVMAPGLGNPPCSGRRHRRDGNGFILGRIRRSESIESSLRR